MCTVFLVLCSAIHAPLPGSGRVWMAEHETTVFPGSLPISLCGREPGYKTTVRNETSSDFSCNIQSQHTRHQNIYKQLIIKCSVEVAIMSAVLLTAGEKYSNDVIMM